MNLGSGVETCCSIAFIELNSLLLVPFYKFFHLSLSSPSDSRPSFLLQNQLAISLPAIKPEISSYLFLLMGFPGGSDGKESACDVETWVQSPGWEEPLVEGMATQSSILAWRISRTEKPGGLQSMGSQRVRHDGATFTSLSSQ